MSKQFEIHDYPDGTSYVKLLTSPKLLNPELVYRINSYKDLWLLGAVKDLYDYHKIPVSLVIPWFIDGQADKRFSEEESFGLRLICTFINNLKFSKVSIFHPHNSSVDLIIDNCRIIDNSEFIKQVIEKLNIPDLVIVSPDAGALKWIYKLADKIGFKGDIVCAGKVREHEPPHKLTQVLNHESFNGKPVLIIDDMCLFGGTFLGLAKLLKDKFAGQLYLAVSHITVTNPSKELEKVFDTVFTTNSKFLEEYKKNLQNVEIINLF